MQLLISQFQFIVFKINWELIAVGVETSVALKKVFSADGRCAKLAGFDETVPFGTNGLLSLFCTSAATPQDRPQRRN